MTTGFLTGVAEVAINFGRNISFQYFEFDMSIRHTKCIVRKVPGV